MAMDADRSALVGRELSGRGWTVAVAESCTGGLLGGRLTAVAGSSRYFRGGIIAYANDVKERLLGVAPGAIEAEGAVSATVAEAMARGVAAALGADVGVGVTGVAGPDGGTAAKPVGLVFVAVSRGRTCEVRAVRLAGDRAAVREAAVDAALDLLMTCLQQWA
ncbi:MAG: nicotinamide-nucleotide amidohydrolase family protein [Lentisphaerae bacterium]|nr:nicotinamide-nucleotide amidohydrolase family protein [Lentisphaerota bacterium]